MRKYLSIMIIITLLVGVVVSPAQAAFSDMKGHWAAATVDKAIADNVTKGYPDGQFRPDAKITEAEFLAMLIRTFSDTTDGAPWYQPYYDFAEAKNYPVSTNPDAVILRTRVAEIIAGTQGVNYSGNDAIQYLLGKGLSKGNDPYKITIETYGGGSSLTRAEAVQFIYNIKVQGISELKERPFEPSPVSELPDLPVVKYVPVGVSGMTIDQTVGIEIHGGGKDDGGVLFIFDIRDNQVDAQVKAVRDAIESCFGAALANEVEKHLRAAIADNYGYGVHFSSGVNGRDIEVMRSYKDPLISVRVYQL